MAVEKGRGNVIDVDPDKCIACGACLDVCEHNAREYIDDVEQFFEDLKKGVKISVLIAPAFLANYPKEYEAYLGMLKKLGVNRFISVSFGADITTWGYIKYITENKFYGGISQPCPAVVGYIERYMPVSLRSLEHFSKSDDCIKTDGLTIDEVAETVYNMSHGDGSCGSK